MAAKIVIAIDDELEHAGVQLREVQKIVRNTNMLTVAYVTTPVKSWGDLKEFFSEYNTGMSYYLFDELEKERQSAQFYRSQAKASLSLSNKTTAENEQLKIRIGYLEKRLEQAKSNT